MERISKEQYDKEAAQLEKLEAMGITPFIEPKRRWMKETIKFHGKNNKNLGISAVNWARLAETVR